MRLYTRLISGSYYCVHSDEALTMINAPIFSAANQQNPWVLLWQCLAVIGNVLWTRAVTAAIIFCLPFVYSVYDSTDFSIECIIRIT